MNVAILPLSHTLWRRPSAVGGDKTHIVEFANALSRVSGVAVTLLYPGAADWTLLSRAVRVRDLGFPAQDPRQSGLPSLVSWAARAARAARAFARSSGTAGRQDVFYVRFGISSLIPLVALRSASGARPVMLEINTPAFLSIPSPPGVLIDSLALRLCSQVSLVSEDLRRLMVARYGDTIAGKTFVNPSGVDPTVFKPGGAASRSKARSRYGLSADDFVVGYCGVVLPHHRLDSLARCVGELGHDSRLVVIGSATRADSDRIVREADGRALLLGQVPYSQVPAFLDMCDALVLPHGPSYREILHQSPIKLFEYMAMAKPVVGSRIGQISEVIQEEVNGLLFHWQSETELLGKLRRLKQDPMLRERLGAAARETVCREFTWDANARRFLQAIGYT